MAKPLPFSIAWAARYTKTDKGIKSQDLYLDILNYKKDYVSLQAYSKQLLNTGKVTAKRQVKLQDLYEQSYFLEVQTKEEAGKTKEAIARYKKFVKENPKSKLAEKAGWNVVQLYFKLLDLKRGGRCFSLFC